MASPANSLDFFSQNSSNLVIIDFVLRTTATMISRARESRPRQGERSATGGGCGGGGGPEQTVARLHTRPPAIPTDRPTGFGWPPPPPPTEAPGLIIIGFGGTRSLSRSALAGARQARRSPHPTQQRVTSLTQSKTRLPRPPAARR